MAIQLEFIDLIVPIATIKAKYPGGWEQCLKDHELSIGSCVWYDDYLFRDGAMNPMDIEALLDQWESLGFILHVTNEKGEPTQWLDVCVYESFFGGATLDCDWIEYDRVSGGAYLTGTEPGKLVGRATFKNTQNK
jgi:hypothetical protein